MSATKEEVPAQTPFIEITPEQKIKLIKEIRPLVEAEVRADLEAVYAEKQVSFMEDLKAENARILKEELDKIRKEMKPPDPNDIKKLLSQEYETFTFEIAGEKETKTFVIKELPMFVEKKFYKQFQESLVPNLKQLAAIQTQLSLDEGDLGDKLQHILDLFPPALNMLASSVAISLNPYDSPDGVDSKWIEKNMSSHRILMVMLAQIEANKMRDFFQHLFKSALGGLK